MFVPKKPRFCALFSALKVHFLPGIFEIVRQTIGNFRHFLGSYLTVFGVKKVVFLIFSKMRYLGRDKALFFVYE